jgi:beta-lactamase class A
MATTLRALALDGVLLPVSRELFNGWLIGNKTGDAKLRADLAKDWRIGDKTGAGGNGTTNDIAVIWPPGRAPVVVTMFMTETALTMPQTNPAFAEVGRLVASAFET